MFDRIKSLFIGRAEEVSSTRVFSVPENTRVYAVGDIHGRYDLLLDCLEKIDRDASTFEGDVFEVFLGDYVDRGPQSAEVVKTLCGGPSGSRTRICLKGNHEEMLMQCLRDPHSLSEWLNYGGRETLASYGINVGGGDLSRDLENIRSQLVDAVAGAPRAFFERLESSFELGDYYFVHAGIKPKRKLSEQTDSDRLWIRDEFLQYSGSHPKRVVHGHTPIAEPEVLPNRINLDTGAYATNTLAVLVLEGSSERFL
ncbi:metallophosphoesterase [Pseudovibrio japonicus]|uniref:Metallophosphoesterase n=1 Tax=Pseudovibrio japonicus TaxID=366534 RepID=A0ABQ3ETL7_9HYPH|nr:metallophosphoesterase family protein [Pseudovibrio japonicus]GHB49696.1 metallophosphoesterase [Pseudovibrio japonicus]